MPKSPRLRRSWVSTPRFVGTFVPTSMRPLEAFWLPGVTCLLLLFRNCVNELFAYPAHCRSRSLFCPSIIGHLKCDSGAGRLKAVSLAQRFACPRPAPHAGDEHDGSAVDVIGITDASERDGRT